MQFKVEEWVKQTAQSDRIQAMPVMTYPGLPLTGKKVIDVVTSGEAQAECIAVLADRYPAAAGVMVMDLSVEAEAFGAPVKFSDDEIPTVSRRVVYDQESIDALTVPRVGAARTGEYLKAATLASARSSKPIFGGMIGPISLAGRLFDMTEIMTFILMDPDAAHVLLDKCTRFLTEYAKAYKDAGAAGLIIAEPAAGLLSPDNCASFSSTYVKRIADAAQDEGFIVILHNCGNTLPLVPAMLSTGCRGYHFGNAVDMKDILPQIPADILAFGNLDPVGVFKMGTPEAVREETKRLMALCRTYGNFIPSSGCDIPPGSPLANIDAFYEVVDAFRRDEDEYKQE